jgi:hypothetical protein
VTTPSLWSPTWRRYAARRGHSARQGTHQLAQRCTSSGRPLPGRRARSSSREVTVVSLGRAAAIPASDARQTRGNTTSLTVFIGPGRRSSAPRPAARNRSIAPRGPRSARQAPPVAHPGWPFEHAKQALQPPPGHAHGTSPHQGVYACMHAQSSEAAAVRVLHGRARTRGSSDRDGAEGRRAVKPEISRHPMMRCRMSRSRMLKCFTPSSWPAPSAGARNAPRQDRP